MLVKKIIEEDFTDYKMPHMFIAAASCTFKCDKLNGCKVCQNAELTKQPSINIDMRHLIQKYLSNNLTHAVVFGGLEPLDTFTDLMLFLHYFRTCYNCNDDVVIYTGYTKEQIADKLELLCKYPNIVVKFGPFLLNRPSRDDEVLGVTLASDNQYAERIS